MIRGSFLARRMNSSRLLLATVMLTVLITTALVAALASFATQTLPQAVRAQLARSPALSVAITGTMGAPQASAATRIIRASLGPALPGVGYRLDRAFWSDLLTLPAPRGSKTIPLIQVAAPGQVRTHAVLTTGTWPGPPSAGQPIGVALPVLAAEQLHARPGTILQPRDRTSGARVPLRVTGLFRLSDPGAGYWRIDLLARSGVSSQPPFISYGPAVASPAAFGPGRLTVGSVSWIALLDPDGIRPDDLDSLAGNVSQAAAQLQTGNSLNGAQVTTGVPQLLTGLASNLAVARSLLAIGALQLALLAAAALALAARLLAGSREEESALLSARGATRWQLTGPPLAETVLVASVAAAAGVLIGTRLAALLVRVTESRSGIRLSGIPVSAWWAALAVLVFAAAIMLWPAVRPVAPGAARVRRGRQAALAGAARAGADLALLAVAVLAVWQLQTYSAVAHPVAGGLGIDPVIAVAPALALAAVTVLVLRLLPAVARLTERAAARGRRLAVALAGWQISRRPIRQSGPFLLVILATAALTLALAQYQTSRRSAADQAAFAAGADLRATLATPLPLPAAGVIARSPGVRSAMPVATGTAGAGGELLAIDARSAAATVLLRGDLSAEPAPQLWRRLTGVGPASGVAIPGRPARLEITASLTPGSGAARPGPAAVTVTVQDTDGVAYLLSAGTLPADGRVHTLAAGLSATRQAAYPLRLLGLSATYELPPYHRFPQQTGPPSQLVIGGLTAAPAAHGPVTEGRALASWAAAASSATLNGAAVPSTAALAVTNGSPPVLTSWRSAGSSQRLSFSPGYTPSTAVLRAAKIPDAGFTGTLTVTARAPGAAIPGIATDAFLHAAHARVGTVLAASASGIGVPVRVVAAIRSFPAVTGGGGALIVDQARLQQILASRQAAPLPVTEWWLATGRSSPPPALRGATVTSRAALAAALLGNSLAAPPRQAALAVGLAAALLAVIGFSISVAASVRGRRAESAVLSALGVARSAQAGQLCLEQLMLSVPAAAAGTLVGAGLAWLVVPAVTLTASAARPQPPVLVEIPVGWAALLAAAVAALPVLAAAASILRRPDPAAELRAAEAS
jgi:FtsX-like permease family